MFTNEEYADMPEIYGEAVRNEAQAKRLCSERFPRRKFSNEARVSCGRDKQFTLGAYSPN